MVFRYSVEKSETARFFFFFFFFFLEIIEDRTVSAFDSHHSKIYKATFYYFIQALESLWFT